MHLPETVDEYVIRSANAHSTPGINDITITDCSVQGWLKTLENSIMIKSTIQNTIELLKFRLVSCIQAQVSQCTISVYYLYISQCGHTVIRR